jgi:hypothetical protein
LPEWATAGRVNLVAHLPNDDLAAIELVIARQMSPEVHALGHRTLATKICRWQWPAPGGLMRRAQRKSANGDGPECLAVRAEELRMAQPRNSVGAQCTTKTTTITWPSATLTQIRRLSVGK